MWELLNKYSVSNHLYYKSKILTIILNTLINLLPTDRKNFLYRIFDSIVDVLGKENMLDKVNGGGDDVSFQRQCLEEIAVKSRVHKTIQNLIRDMLKFLFQKLQDRDFKSFFYNYRDNLDKLEDEILREYMDYTFF